MQPNATWRGVERRSVQVPHLRPMRIVRVGMGNRFPAVNWRRSTALPILTALAPTPGGMSRKYRMRENRPTLLAIDRSQLAAIRWSDDQRQYSAEDPRHMKRPLLLTAAALIFAWINVATVLWLRDA